MDQLQRIPRPALLNTEKFLEKKSESKKSEGENGGPPNASDKSGGNAEIPVGFPGNFSRNRFRYHGGPSGQDLVRLLASYLRSSPTANVLVKICSHALIFMQNILGENDALA